MRAADVTDEADDTLSATEPRLAATVLLVRDDPFQVLMVKRSPIGSFPSKQVFPGGVVETEDWSGSLRECCEGGSGLADEDVAFRVAGMRECWEEAGILCARGEFALEDHWSPRASLPPLLERLGVRFDLDAAVDFGHWITPPTSPRRWSTRFLIMRAPDNQQLCCDGEEALAAEWIEPAIAIEMAGRGERDIVFSTIANLHLLAQSTCVEDAISAARNRPMIFVTPSAERRDGRVHVSIPVEAGFPVSEGWIDEVRLTAVPQR